MITLLINNSCSKSNCALDYSKQFPSLNIKLRAYLDTPLGKNELLELLQKLSVPVSELVRSSNRKYLEIIGEKTLTKDEIVALLVAHPDLLQRPILIDEKQAIIGRPPELILEYLKAK